ncbi:MAG: L-2-hydroxyglutarate oxidase [Acidobacteriaceae bacterium]|nr:L-2-hydroxyglutarate oxidase [Acidobacteriaceae bacterium]
MEERQFDVAIIGGGIIGLATALHFLRMFPSLRLAVLEKEDSVGQHQTGHNSGVIHSGIYYKPGSLKARLCVEGAAAMCSFCQEHDIPMEICGKVIVATNQDEVPRLHALLERGQANGIAGLKMLDRGQVREIEPNCGGVAWLHVPGTGITNYEQVCQKYADIVVAQGGLVKTATEAKCVVQRNSETIVESNQGSLITRFVVNCAGLQSDRITQASGVKPEVRIVPFRGEYYDLTPDRKHLVRNLIYPVPDLRFPFLGVHFTRRITGEVDAGPNAVLAFKREGYRKTDFSLRDVSETFSYSGFWKMAAKYWKDGSAEFYRSFSKSAFVHALQRLVPEVRNADLIRNGSGVRAQALRRDGSLVDDFQFACTGKMLHVWNVPSPAATASLAIGREIALMAQQGFGLQTSKSSASN